MRLARLALALALPFLLASCLLSPGKFVSTLDIRADRSFTFTYVGEILVTEQEPAEGDPPGFGRRSRAREAAAKAEREAAEAETIRSRHAMADALSREPGYRSVEYLGGRTFRVDYAMTGRLDRSFFYPMNVDAGSVEPWIAIELRKDGTARILAPAFGDDDKDGKSAEPNPEMAQRDGTFTFTTDAPLVSHNGEAGPGSAPGTRIDWRVTPARRPMPTAEIRFPQ